MRSFGMIGKRITDPRSLGSRCIKGTDKSTLGKDSSVPLMHHDPSDLGSVILFRIIPKERTLKLSSVFLSDVQGGAQSSSLVGRPIASL